MDATKCEGTNCEALRLSLVGEKPTLQMLRRNVARQNLKTNKPKKIHEYQRIIRVERA